MTTHEYQRDPQSGAGNCVCGGALRHRRHPHVFMAAMNRPDLCTCALPLTADQHLGTAVDGDDPDVAALYGTTGETS